MLIVMGMPVSGRAVDENDNFRLLRPFRTVTGRVMGIFPYAPKNATVRTDDGEYVTIRIEKVI